MATACSFHALANSVAVELAADRGRRHVGRDAVASSSSLHEKVIGCGRERCSSLSAMGAVRQRDAGFAGVMRAPRGAFLTGSHVRLDVKSHVHYLKHAQRTESARLVRGRATSGATSVSTDSVQSAERAVDTEADAGAIINWDEIGFDPQWTDFMYVRVGSRDGVWKAGELKPFGKVELNPFASVINYGQGVFEGLKASRTEDDRILLFRPDANAARMDSGGKRMCMPTLTTNEFVEAIIETVVANQRWIPPYGKGSLYIRPLLIGTGAVLGLVPSPECTFLICVSPVGSYFKQGQMTPLNLVIDENHHRAAPGGTGNVKAISNYSAVLLTQLEAKKIGYADVIYLDAVEGRYIEEVSSCNLFIVKGGKLSTPKLGGTILPGITRRSILELAVTLGYEVSERHVSIDDLLDADEVFCTGTAVVLSSVGSVTFRGKKTTYSDGGVGKVSAELYKTLTDLQTGRTKDTMGWTVEISH